MIEYALNRRQLTLLFLFTSLVVTVYLTNRRLSLVNFTELDGPQYVGNYAPVPAVPSDQIRVVNWNIKFGEKIDKAIEELQRVEFLQKADVVLLQEMDQEGVERIASELGYNYVYYPASIHDRTSRDFGNAILSLWPMHGYQKVLLPHESPTNGQRRIVIGAIITVGDQEIAVYTTHTETPALSRSKRIDQINSIGALLKDETPYCAIIGGDFNTFSSRSVQALEETMATYDLVSVLTKPQTTVKIPFLAFSPDHLFVRGFNVIESGVSTDTTASDHYPIWANLEPCTVPEPED